MTYSMKIELDPDVEEIANKLAGTSDTVLDAAKAVAEVARAMAPVDTGEYAASIKAERAGRKAVVVSDSPHAHWVEFGAPARGIEPQWVFHRAAMSLGFKFKRGK